MNPIKIDCPACGARGKIRTVSPKCPYCGGKKTVKLTFHLKRIGHEAELKNVEDYQRRMEAKTTK